MGKLFSFANRWDGIRATKRINEGQTIIQLLEELRANFPKTFLEFEPDETHGEALTADELEAFNEWRRFYKPSVTAYVQAVRPKPREEPQRPVIQPVKQVKPEPQQESGLLAGYVTATTDSHWYQHTVDSPKDYAADGGAFGFEGFPSEVRFAINNAMAEYDAGMDDEDWYSAASFPGNLKFAAIAKRKKLQKARAKWADENEAA